MEQLTEGKFEFIRGRAEFTDSHHLKVKLLDGGEEEIEGKTFLISTGSVINFIDLPGLKETGFLDSDTALDSDRFPRSVVILGGRSDRAGICSFLQCARCRGHSPAKEQSSHQGSGSRHR